MRHTFTVDDINPDLPADEKAAFTKRLLEADNKGIFTPISLKDTVHVPTSNGGMLMGGVGCRTPTGAIYLVAHENPGILAAAETGRRAAAAARRRCRLARASTRQNCQACHGANREGRG